MGCIYYDLCYLENEKEIREENARRSLFQCKRGRDILEYWRSQIDVEEGKRIDVLDEVKINCIYDRLAKMEWRSSWCNISLLDYDEALIHAEQSMLFVILLVTGNKRTYRLYEALKCKSEVLICLAKNSEARVLREESYMVISRNQKVVIPQV